ncbi:MAG: RluA family pseudouridine synthase [Defluviitaleaceae bacterium]|nr:RluA family pseudouridine synthase [Defluviitaleaceae bacterium]
MRDIEILYEDKELVVVCKSPGVPCQPDKTGADDLATVLSSRIGYIGVVHRLDRPVGGVMVFAKTKEANAKLSQQASRGFQKTYLAVVQPEPGEVPKRGELRHFLVKNERLGVSSVVDRAHVRGAKEAVLRYELCQTIYIDGATLSLLKVNLLTGRHHQIRVQLASAGMPIWGDTKYGRKQRPGHNVALWAYSLGLRHPSGGREMSFTNKPRNAEPFDLFELTDIDIKP